MCRPHFNLFKNQFGLVVSPTPFLPDRWWGSTRTRWTWRCRTRSTPDFPRRSTRVYVAVYRRFFDGSQSAGWSCFNERPLEQRLVRRDGFFSSSLLTSLLQNSMFCRRFSASCSPISKDLDVLCLPANRRGCRIRRALPTTCSIRVRFQYGSVIWTNRVFGDLSLCSGGGDHQQFYNVAV
jgi:hypothetical protein